MKLLSATDFILEQNRTFTKDKPLHETDWSLEFEKFSKLIIRYAEFLKKPLTLGMFVHCYDDGQIHEKPSDLAFQLAKENNHSASKWAIEEYELAKEKVLFKGFTVKDDYAIGIFEDEMIYIDEEFCQDINIDQFLNTIWSEIELTESAIKQIAL